MASLQLPLAFEDQMLQMIKEVDKAERINFIKHRNLHTWRINNEGHTLLHISAKYSDFEITKILIEAGSDVNAQDSLNNTPIMLAIENKFPGYPGVIDILIQAYAHIRIVNNRGKTAAQLFLEDFRCDYDSILEFFISEIYCNCMKNSEMTASNLMSLGYSLKEAILLGNSEVIEQMIKQGCSVVDTEDKTSILGKAVERMDLEVIKVLIRYGANVDARDGRKFLPISRYYCYNPDTIQKPEIIKILLRESILLRDLRQNDIIEQLKPAFECGNREVIQMLLEHDNDILNIRDRRERTPLHYIATNYHSDVIELLQDRKFEVNARDVSDCTPLYVACENSDVHINTYKFLLKNGADVNAKTMYGSNSDVPLFCLCRATVPRNSFLKIIELFLEYNLDIQYVASKSEERTTVFDIILNNQKFYLAKPLVAHLAILDALEKPINDLIRKKITSYQPFKMWFIHCKAELAEMKNNVINDNLTLYMLVVNDKNYEQALKSCRYNPTALPKFKEMQVMFGNDKYYHNVVQNRISPILSKLELWQKSAPVLCEILKFRNDPHHIVIVEIINYLHDEDLENLIKVKI